MIEVKYTYTGFPVVPGSRWKVLGVYNLYVEKESFLHHLAVSIGAYCAQSIVDEVTNLFIEPDYLDWFKDTAQMMGYNLVQCEVIYPWEGFE